MSRISNRSRPVSERGQREKNYKLFLVDFHGTGLNPIREKFVERVEEGLRRKVFIIDLDKEADRFRRITRKSRNAPQEDSFMFGLAVALAAINERRQKYDDITKEIETEQAFDLLQYWMDQLDSTANTTQVNSMKPAPTSKKALDTIPEKTDRKKRKSAGPSQFPEKPVELVCPPLVVREHNSVGNEKSLAMRKYIEDDPPFSKLFIVLLGSNLSKLYDDLLSANQPVQAIIHFIPEKNAYDRLVPRPNYDKYLRHIVRDVRTSFDLLRVPEFMKPVGLLQQFLPVISHCLAQKYADQIYDELSWYLYDVELLHRHYQLYYVTPFNETNVEMDRRVNIKDLFNTAESLSIQGHFLNSPLPAAGTDIASIAMFLEGLISTVQLPDEALPQYQSLLSTGLWTASIFSSHGALASTYKNAFNSITKIKSVERLVVERNNPLLCSLVSYMNLDKFSNIHQSCLEYNIIRRYVLSTYVIDCAHVNPPEKELEPFFLPQFCKLFLPHDSVIQRLTQLLTEYDHYEVDILHPGYTLYHFKRRYNEVVRHQKMVVLPTRLCFRDFTLFQMDAFLEGLVTQGQRKSGTEGQNLNDTNNNTQRNTLLGIDKNVFTRLLSLKMQNLQRLMEDNDLNAGTLGTTKRKTRLTTTGEEEPLNEDFVGLPPGHPLLQGYNLEDVRQEIYINTSCYHFEEGHLKIYEDRYCMTDLNKNMHLNINQCSINVCRPRWSHGISRNIHIRTRNDVTCRVFGKEDECAQIVINYPNSLAVYFHRDYSEQMWNLQETVNDEARRLMIPEGAVIIHYHAEDVVRILRHNGEVYELLQYELVTEEGEEGYEESLGETSLDTAAQTSENRVSGSTRKSKFKSIPIIGKERSTENLSFKSNSKKRRKKMLWDSIKNELNFLNIICAIYGLQYLHLKLTTTVGRRIEVTNMGKIIERSSLENSEWRDYFANEYYAMRSDGVKIIWTKVALKCFHRDGTIITSGVAENTERVYFDDEFDSRISGSSSHNMEEEEENELVEKPMEATSVDKQINYKAKTKAKGNTKSYENYILHEMEEEHVQAEDKSYVCCESDKFLIQHKCYASVNFLILRSSINDVKVIMNIFAADKIQVEISLEDVEQDTSFGDDEDYSSEIGDSVKCKPKKTIMYTTHFKGGAEQVLQMPRSSIKINIGDDVQLKVTDDTCLIKALVERYDKKCGKQRDVLRLGFQFDDDICSLFQEFVELISLFKNYQRPVGTDLYFLQKYNDECTISQGFEFYRRLPPLGEYNFTAGNTTIDMRGFQSVTELMSNKYEWFEKDMEKFPRFQNRKPKPRFSNDVPMVVAADFYCKIPRRLLNTEEIKKFLEPFDKITFKQTRVHIRDALEFYLHPEFRIKLKQLASKMSWRRRHEDHRRTLLIQMQRKGLYHAMLKHKTYPKYHEFTYGFRNHVSNIEFFDFVQYKCMRPQI